MFNRVPSAQKLRKDHSKESKKQKLEKILSENISPEQKVELLEVQKAKKISFGGSKDEQLKIARVQESAVQHREEEKGKQMVKTQHPKKSDLIQP